MNNLSSWADEDIETNLMMAVAIERIISTFINYESFKRMISSTTNMAEHGKAIGKSLLRVILIHGVNNCRNLDLVGKDTH